MRSAAAAASSMSSQARRSGSGRGGRKARGRASGGRRQLVAVADALAQPRQGDLGVVAVDLAREAVAVEHGLGEQSRGDAVADAEDGRAAAVELVEERVVGHALGDEDDAGGRQLERLARRRRRA